MKYRLRVLALTLLVAGSAIAQQPPTRPGRGGSRVPPSVPTAVVPPPPRRGDLRDRFGPMAATRLLSSSSITDRRRGAERLATLGTPQAIDALTTWLTSDPSLALDATLLLGVVRGLAPIAAEKGARDLVEQALLGNTTRRSSKVRLLRETAALALANTGDTSAYDLLVATAKQGGEAAEAATKALVIAPPARIATLLGPRAPLTTANVTLVAAVGDLRGVPFLRRAVREGPPDTRLAALAALAKLGDGEAELIARGWVHEGDEGPRFAALRVLAVSAPDVARPHVIKLLNDAKTRDFGLELAQQTPGKELVPALVAAIGKGVPRDDERAIATLGRCGDAGVKALAALLSNASVAHLAGVALALAPGGAARDAITRALGEPATRAVALRAATVRALERDDEPSGVSAAIDHALSEGDGPTAAAVFAAIALKKRAISDADLASPVRVAAAVRALLGQSSALAKLLPKLAAAKDDAVTPALGAALVADPFAEGVPSATLIAFVDAHGALAPLAARALAARDADDDRALVTRLLEGPDDTLRAHAARGLARSANPDATGRLRTAFLAESEPLVRRAIVRALAERSEPSRLEPLRVAATLDADAVVREIAKRALAKPEPTRDDAADLGHVGWLVVRGAKPDATLAWERPDGLVIPVRPDADGSVLVPGLGAGASRVTLAQEAPVAEKDAP